AEERKRRKLTAALAAAGLLLVGLAGTGAWWYQRERDARHAELVTRQVATERDVMAGLDEARKQDKKGRDQADDPDRWQRSLKGGRGVAEGGGADGRAPPAGGRGAGRAGRVQPPPPFGRGGGPHLSGAGGDAGESLPVREGSPALRGGLP